MEPAPLFVGGQKGGEGGKNLTNQDLPGTEKSLCRRNVEIYRLQITFILWRLIFQLCCLGNNIPQ